MIRRSLSAAILAAFLLAGTQAAADVKLSIRFFDKRIYFPGSEIPLMITISNESDATYRFKVADDRVYSLSFEARTPSNRLLDLSDGYKVAMSQSKPVFYRELAIKPGEEYSFKEGLERFVRVDTPGIYAIRAVFFPELASSSAAMPISSNILSLSVRPSPGLPPATEAIRAVTGEAIKALALPPDEVVRRTIVARQKDLWNDFFVYLDLESLISRDQDRKKEYDAESDEGRRRLLERYRADLQTNVRDNDIVVQPYYFEILETRYTEAKGFVSVLEKFQSGQLRMVKEYTYELRRRDEVWYIVDYTVFNKGTE
ncbi:MAG: hypothetical protein ABSF43_01130 [Rectinemataceae bacterium]